MARHCWAVRSGFGHFAEPRPDAGDEPPLLRAVKDEATGQIKMLKPEMIVGLLLEMATGDDNMPKGGHKDDVTLRDAMKGARVAAIAGPRSGWKRKQGEFGAGAYSEEPWSLQSLEKRLYAIRDFYTRELKGTGLENPGLDELVDGTRKALVLLIGRKAMHVPQALTTKQLAAFVGTADPTNPALTLIAAEFLSW